MTGLGRIEVEGAAQVTPDPEAREDAERRRDWHRQQHAEEAEGGAPGQKREDDKHVVQLHPVAEQPRIDDVAFEDLAQEEDRSDIGDPVPVRKLGDGETDRELPRR